MVVPDNPGQPHPLCPQRPRPALAWHTPGSAWVTSLSPFRPRQKAVRGQEETPPHSLHDSAVVSWTSHGHDKPGAPKLGFHSDQTFHIENRCQRSCGWDPPTWS